MSDAQDDLTRERVEIRRWIAETDKLRAEQQKLLAEAPRLLAEQQKLMAERDKLVRDRGVAPWLAIVGVVGAITGLVVGASPLILKLAGY
jgi:ElaB/YqjD/DUF883 family membrane-anchored ribosome-binding protein